MRGPSPIGLFWRTLGALAYLADYITGKFYHLHGSFEPYVRQSYSDEWEPG